MSYIANGLLRNCDTLETLLIQEFIQLRKCIKGKTFLNLLLKYSKLVTLTLTLSVVQFSGNEIRNLQTAMNLEIGWVIHILPLFSGNVIVMTLFSVVGGEGTFSVILSFLFSVCWSIENLIWCLTFPWESESITEIELYCGKADVSTVACAPALVVVVVVVRAQN